MGKLLINRDGSNVREIELFTGSITIGRAKDNNIQLNDSTVSSHHAKIVTTPHESYIEDLGSTNGVRVNGAPVVFHVLQADDVISIGKHEIVFHAGYGSSVEQNAVSRDTHAGASNAGAGASSARLTSTLTDVFPNAITRGDITPNTAQERSVFNAAEHGIRVVVNNNADSAKQRPLDIDINFDKFAARVESGGLSTPALGINRDVKKENPYIDTRRYSEPLFATPTESAQVEPQRKEKNNTFTASVAAQASSQQRQPALPSQKTTANNKSRASSTRKSSAPPNLKSKQPFMTSEEVVQHLITLGRERNKTSRKSSGLSSLVGVIVFGLIAITIYYQLR